MFDIPAAQRVSGYGNITGYGAGARLLSPTAGSGGGSVAALASARHDSPITFEGLLVGSSVHTAWGVGLLVRVIAAGALGEVAFPAQTLGAACFPYCGHTAIIPSTALRAVPCGAAGIAALEASCGSSASEAAASAAVATSIVRARFGGPGAGALVSVVLPRGSDEVAAACGAPSASALPLLPLAPPARELLSITLDVLLRAVGEKLDLLRAVAGDALGRLLHLPPPLPPLYELGGAHRAVLVSVFPPPMMSMLTHHAKGGAGVISTTWGVGEGEGEGEEEGEGEGAGEEGNNLTAARGANGGAAAESNGGGVVDGSGSSVQWGIPHQCFSRLMPLLNAKNSSGEEGGATSPFALPLLEGLASSIGGLSESVVKHSTRA